MKFYIHTWGCQMNVYDSERLADLLTANGYEEVPEAESADIILLNTCAVRENAKEKIYHQLGRWKELKRANPNSAARPRSTSSSDRRPCTSCPE